MKNILLIQHTPVTTPGILEPYFQTRPHSLHHTRLHLGDTFPSPDKFDGVVICGGGVHVDQEDMYPWLRAEKRLIQKFLRRGTPIIGLCLGAQLCAEALGTPAFPHPQGWEVGWHEVTLNKVPGLAGFEKERTLNFSQYHRYVFEAPKDAIVIARNKWWQVQGFAWKNQVLAFQFHPERSIESNTRLANCPDLPTQGQIQTREEILTLGTQHQPTAAQWFEEVVTNFLKLTPQAEVA